MNGWKIVDWDGNPELGLKCWRKNFRLGHVSIGIDKFNLIVYSYGADSAYSLSGTRWRPNGIMTEHQAMVMVDRNKGSYNYKDNEP